MKIYRMILCLILLLSLCSCSHAKVMPNDALGEALVGCALPSGTVYTLGEGGGGIALTQDLLSRLFGDCEEAVSGVEYGAIYLSARETVCEAAVFYCYAAGEARDMAELCLARGEALARYDDVIVSKVTVKGKYVLWAACEEPETVVAALARAVKG